MSTSSNKKEGDWMFSLQDVAFIKWNENKAKILANLMDNAKPKKISTRELAFLINEYGYSANYQTIQKMRTGKSEYVIPETILGVCKVFELDLDTFLDGPLAKIKKYD